ncbi:tau 95 subunit of transcription factor TFIIIC [Irineochytrium annulatum]|nr:tau 95 subunit of transcription factor TFIIIC [Irineochytrium annulatum]
MEEEITFERAPSFPLPNWNFSIVEYPGRVVDVDKAIQTLGGTRAIEKAFTPSDPKNPELNFLELRFRPDDPFCHPIIGEIIPTSNLLLKYTRKRRKKPTGPDGHWAPEDVIEKTEIVGMVTKTARFRADFQFLVNPDDPMIRLRKAIAEYDIPEIEKFEFEKDQGIVENLRVTLPPVMSRTEWPPDYRYRPNQYYPSRRKTVAAADGVHLHSFKRTVTAFCRVSKATDDIPLVAPPAVLESAKAEDPAALARVEALFARRPIWSRLALLNNLPQCDHARFLRLVASVAFNYAGGPWAKLWCRYGYDPRKEKGSRFYQVLELRFVKPPRALVRAKRLLRIEDPQQLLVGQVQMPSAEGAAAPRDTTTHIFDGTVWKNAASLQICDVTDPEVTALLDPGRVRRTFDAKFGWFEADFLVHLRNVVRNKVNAQTGREIRDLRGFNDANGEENENENDRDGEVGGGNDGDGDDDEDDDLQANIDQEEEENNFDRELEEGAAGDDAMDVAEDEHEGRRKEISEGVAAKVKKSKVADFVTKHAACSQGGNIILPPGEEEDEFAFFEEDDADDDDDQ